MYKDKEAAIQAAVKTRSIDPVCVAAAFGCASAREWAKTTGEVFDIDLSVIKDDRVAAAVVKAVFGFFRDEAAVKNPNAAYNRKVRGMKCALRENQEMFAMGYDDFVVALASMDVSKEKQDTKTALYAILYNGIDMTRSEAVFRLDVWFIANLPLSKDRVNPASYHRTLSFSSIENKTNKDLIKKYIRYLFEDTHNSVGTIIGKKGRIASMLNAVGDIPYPEYTEKEFDKLVGHLKETKKDKNQVGVAVQELERFTRFLINNGLMESSELFKYHSLTLGIQYEFRETDRNEYIIVQIFNVLDQVKPASVQIWFLLMFTTGMRISEASAMRRDCLEKNAGTGACFVHFYSQKMKKEVVNVIPEALYEMISEYIAETKAVNGYLFPSPIMAGHPMESSSFRAILNREFKRLGIRNPDGTQYVFKAHDLRHWMAKQMYDENIPVQFIQEQLHHASPEMTMAYVEFLNRRKAEKMRVFVDMNGKNSPLVPMDNKKYADDWHYADYVSRNMNVTVLPNGLCARPKKLGRCGSANSCLTCSEFRTSKEDLPKHKDHLARLDAFIEAADKNGWEDQAEESRAIREHLVRIICALEDKGGAGSA